ncbi:MAG TPA: urease accessory protein UreD [Geminicoccus sp.]|jgi:urease accessory protein|uniref:urease accessory protein UreD n=1 Tax=Geminicoccus sp. TaxID=2024832 RepID=UPI002E34A334|nr:urease accessory protein UreD [Geminicoccus sp.]HEX2526288.1 urease accessory protein UreD [Geminicoccus sp.]
MTVEPTLDLAFRAAPDGTTVLARRRVRHPFSVQAAMRDVRGRPNCARVFVQSASGGIFADETIGQRVVVQDGAELRVEMPAATVVHAMRDGSSSRQRIELRAGAGGLLEYLPRPLILFPSSRLAQIVEVEAADDARLLIGDGFMMHDPQSGGGAFDRFDSRLVVRRPDGALVLDDRSFATGLAMRAQAPGLSGRHGALGSLLMIAPQTEASAPAHVRELHALLEGMAGLHAGATALRTQAGLLVRILAVDGGTLAQAQALVAQRMRDMLWRRADG